MAATWNIEIDKRVTYRQRFTLRDENGDPIDLTGYTAKMQIREQYDSDEALVTLTHEDGITLGDSEYNLVIEILDEDTKDITAESGVYDFILYSPSGSEDKIFKGKATFYPTVTQ